MWPARRSPATVLCLPGYSGSNMHKRTGRTGYSTDALLIWVLGTRSNAALKIRGGCCELCITEAAASFMGETGTRWGLSNRSISISHRQRPAYKNPRFELGLPASASLFRGPKLGITRCVATTHVAALLWAGPRQVPDVPETRCMNAKHSTTSPQAILQTNA